MSALQDLADSPRASACDHPVDHLLEAMCPQCAHPVDAVCPSCGSNVEQSGAGNRQSPIANGTEGTEFASCLTPEEFYRRLVLLMMNSRNTKFTLGCYLIATGSGFADGVSMTDLAKEWGVGKAAVSKQCGIICKYLGIPRSGYMRKEAVAKKFRLSNRRPRKV